MTSAEAAEMKKGPQPCGTCYANAPQCSVEEEEESSWVQKFLAANPTKLK